MNKSQAKVISAVSFVIAGIFILFIILVFITGELDFDTKAFIIFVILPSIVVSLIGLGLFILKRDIKSNKRTTIEKYTEVHNEDKENLSGQGPFSIIPYQVEYGRWNWGGFFLGWVWAWGNSLPWHLILLSLLIPYVMHFVLGAKGNKWAWQYKRWESIEHFWRVQRKWKIWGIIYFSFILFFIILGAIVSTN